MILLSLFSISVLLYQICLRIVWVQIFTSHILSVINVSLCAGRSILLDFVSTHPLHILLQGSNPLYCQIITQTPQLSQFSSHSCINSLICANFCHCCCETLCLPSVRIQSQKNVQTCLKKQLGKELLFVGRCDNYD